MPHKRLKSPEEMYQVARGYKEVHLFFGYGERAQYADVEEIIVALTPYLRQIEQRCGSAPFLAVYGGDKAVKERPDLGWLMFRIRETFNCHLMAIQSAGTPDEHSEYAFVCEQQFETVKRKNPQGVEEEVQEVLYGGTRGGKPVGGARYYLGPEFITKGAGGRRLLTSVFVLGGGGVAVDEAKYADEQHVPWLYIPSRARNEEAYKSTYGPVHTWAKERMDKGAKEGTSFVSITGHNWA